MSWESLLAFNLVLLAALVSPGAAFLVAVRTSVSSGRMAGLVTGFGLASAACLWTLAAFLGLETVFKLFPWTHAFLKMAGAAYLAWLAIQTWRNASTPLPAVSMPGTRAFLNGALVNLGNPKSMLFAGAVILVVFPGSFAPREIAFVVLNHLVLEVLFYCGLAIALSSGAAQRGYLALKPVFDRLAAAVLGVLATRLLMEKS